MIIKELIEILSKYDPNLKINAVTHSNANYIEYYIVSEFNKRKEFKSENMSIYIDKTNTN